MLFRVRVLIGWCYRAEIVFFFFFFFVFVFVFVCFVLCWNMQLAFPVLYQILILHSTSGRVTRNIERKDFNSYRVFQSRRSNFKCPEVSCHVGAMGPSWMLRPLGWIVPRRLIHIFSLLVRTVSGRVPRDSIPCKIISVMEWLWRLKWWPTGVLKGWQLHAFSP